VGKSASAPDPYATATAQGAINESTAKLQARLGNPDTYGPTGSVTHEWRPDDTVATTTSLSPGQQQIFDAVQGGEQSAAKRMQQLLGTGIDTSGLTPYAQMPGSSTSGIQSSLPASALQGIQTSVPDNSSQVRTDFSTGQPLARMSDKDYGAQRSEVENAIMSRVQPQFDKQRDTLNANLAAQGFNVNTAGYRNAADESNRNLTDARMQAVLAGGQEQSRLAGLDRSRLGFNNDASMSETKQYNDALAATNSGLGQRFNQGVTAGTFANHAQQQGYQQQLGAAGFQNQAQQQQFNELGQNTDRTNALRNQQLAETMQLRSQPVNEVASLFGLGNQIAAPAATPFQGGQIQAPNYAQMVQNQYTADSANATSTNNAVAGTVATTAMMAATIA
jgi:hypothetical protein